ncbi:glycosyltransferase family 9 protein [Brevibacterium renqingii]|uniref:glycosyltransferase family 9 protein n=1 Tax=Brevibacterium renqingii TaxID=2776916 RepID=UPI001ADF9DD3|nr:glycosyltransferase family 9 protein [Brevibacterium renqingii]
MVNKHVLAVRLDSMGDLLVTSPALRAIAAADEVGKLTLLCSPAVASTARLLPGVDEIETWSCPWIVSPAPAVEAEDLQRLIDVLTVADIDEAVVFTSFHQSALPTAMVLRLAGISRITAVSVDYPGSLLDERIRPGSELSEDLPEVERGLAIAARAGFGLPDDDDGRPRVVGVRGEAARQCPAETRMLRGERLVVVHPGASVPARRWSPEHMRETVTALAGQGWTVAVTGTPDERRLTDFVAGTAGIDLGGRLDVAGLADLLASCEAIVVGNTGPAHLAAAVGTPVVSLFSPVVPPVRWLPYGVDVEMLGDQSAACRGTRARDCPVSGHPCLNSVSAEDAVSAVHRLLARRPALPEEKESFPTSAHEVRSSS